jgi:hypothetical protein
MNNQLPQDQAITKAIAYTENGGKPDLKNPKKGKTGETASIFQFEPATWKNDAQQVLGNPDAPLTPENETTVVDTKVKQWLQKGYTPQQIFSMWNAGVGEPDAYTGKFSDGTSSSGVNPKYGVAYSVPKYVDTAMSYLKEFNPSVQTSDSDTTDDSTTPTMKGSDDKMNKIISMMVQAKSEPKVLPQMNPGTNPGLLPPSVALNSTLPQGQSGPFPVTA